MNYHNDKRKQNSTLIIYLIMKKYITAVSSRIPTSWMDNKMIATILVMVLAIYAALAAPALPASVIRFFDQWYGKLIFLFLIAFLSVKNIQVALMVSVVFLLILHYAAQLDIQEHFFGSSCKKQEGFTDGVSPDVADVLQQVGLPAPATTSNPSSENANPADLLKNTMNSLQQLSQLQSQVQSESQDIKKSLESEKKMEPATAESTMPPAEQAELPVKEQFQNNLDMNGLLNVSPYDDSDDIGAPFDM